MTSNANTFLGRIVDHIRLQPSIKTIDLQKTYESSFDHGDSFEDIISGRSKKPFCNLIKDSVYSRFLQALKGKDTVSDPEIKETRYFQESLECLKVFGHYQGTVKDETGLLKYCREYLELYQCMKRRIGSYGILRPVLTEMDHALYGYLHVFRVSDVDHWMVYDGHHRAACLYVMGERFVKAKVLGIISGQREHKKSEDYQYGK